MTLNSKTTNDTGHFTPEMASLSNSRWQNCKERQNRSTNNENSVDKAKREILSE